VLINQALRSQSRVMAQLKNLLKSPKSPSVGA
jgi:hypothetical protein